MPDATDTAQMTLSDFLLARIAEDEAVAQAATLGPWSHDTESVWAGDDPTWGVVHASWELAADGTSPDLAHIARHDPARVLAECEAKRKMIGDPDARGGVMYDYFLMCLSLPYAAHPDYREGWKP